MSRIQAGKGERNLTTHSSAAPDRLVVERRVQLSSLTIHHVGSRRERGPQGLAGPSSEFQSTPTLLSANTAAYSAKVANSWQEQRKWPPQQRCERSER